MQVDMQITFSLHSYLSFVQIKHCIFRFLKSKADASTSCLLTESMPGCVCVCVCHVGGISPEPFAMQASFFIHRALTAQRHPSGSSHHTQNSRIVCGGVCVRFCYAHHN